MAIYLLAYDLINEKKGTHDYQPLWDELERLKCHRTEYSLWLCNLNNTPAQVRDHFKQYVDSDDRIWVTKLRPNEYTYSNATNGTNEWIKKNPIT